MIDAHLNSKNFYHRCVIRQLDRITSFVEKTHQHNTKYEMTLSEAIELSEKNNEIVKVDQEITKELSTFIDDISREIGINRKINELLDEILDIIMVQ